MKIYVASSWRNEYQPTVVKALREAGHEVYDFKNPTPSNTGFSWAEIDPNWQQWTNEEYISALDHPIAQKGFESDFNAMQWADACVLVIPCGRSAHVEAGWMQGAGKPTIVLLSQAEPELMYNLFERVALTIDEVLDHCNALQIVLEDISDSESVRSCRVCGCTELNCYQCIEKTGKPCHWVEADLCSACVEPAPSILLPGRDF